MGNMIMKFKIVYVIVLLVAQNVFTFGQKEAVISEDCTGVPTFDITDPHMVFSNGLSVPEVGMNAHNKNGYDEIYLQDLSGRRSEILGQLSIEDHAVTSLTIINPNGIYVDGGSFFGAEKITLSALGQGDVWFNPSRAVLDTHSVTAKKPEVHIQDFKRFWRLFKRDWYSFCSDLEGQDTYELGMSLFIHYSKGNRGPKGGFFKKEFLFLYIEEVFEGEYGCDESNDRAYETEFDESSGSADEASDADLWTPNEKPVVLVVYKDEEIPPEYQKTPLPGWKVAPPEETITHVFSDDNFGDTLAYLFDESLAREASQNLVVKQNRVSVSTLNPIPVTAASALESDYIHIFFSQAFYYNLRAIQFHRAIPSHFIRLMPAGQATT